MADGGYIREYLVGLGFEVDERGLDAFRAAETDEVRVQIIQNNAPVKILPKEGDSFLFLVLPVMLKAKS